jgi:hypothetical protein
MGPLKIVTCSYKSVERPSGVQTDSLVTQFIMWSRDDSQVMNTPASLNSSMVNTPRSHDSPMPNTPWRQNSPRSLSKLFLFNILFVFMSVSLSMTTKFTLIFIFILMFIIMMFMFLRCCMNINMTMDVDIDMEMTWTWKQVWMHARTETDTENERRHGHGHRKWTKTWTWTPDINTDMIWTLRKSKSNTYGAMSDNTIFNIYFQLQIALETINNSTVVLWTLNSPCLEEQKFGSMKPFYQHVLLQML